MAPGRKQDPPEPQSGSAYEAGIDERELDQILADSFPASDAPPWTLGLDEPDAPQHVWFMDTLITVRQSHKAGSDGLSILEQTARRGDSPPLHFHEDEDESFYLLEGEVRFRLQEKDRIVTAGEVVLAPQGVPHTYRVQSERARWLVITTKGRFEAYVRTMARPAEVVDLPPAGGPPSADMIATLKSTAKEFGIQLIGPPLAS